MMPAPLRLAMLLTSGVSFGSYTILGSLGSGGMGEVYRARDRRLGRDVALKVLRDDARSDPERMRRFEHEARAASALNHPNIVVLYETGEAEIPGRETPVRYIAMELLEGEPLSALLSPTPLPMKRFFELAAQLADGLARAHESGIVHRDLKPSNVVVGPTGHLKILDFGLAKREGGLGAEDPTATVQTPTSPGTVLGTVGYMSPEQARGEPATPASDQFSLGCIFYEMLTGRRAFGRSSAAETLSAILRDEPTPIEELNANVPAPVLWIVARCLAKDSRERYASTRDLAKDLITLKEHSGVALKTGPRSSPRARAVRRGIGLAVLLLAAGAAGFFLAARLPFAQTPEFWRLTFRRGVVLRGLFVPKSDSILYTASWDGQPARTYLTLPESAGVDRPLDAEVHLPFAYTDDGLQVLTLLGASRTSIGARGMLASWPAVGGKPRPILQDAGWADWTGDGRLLAAVRDSGAERSLEIRDAKGALRAIFRTPGTVSWVRISPDQKQVAFVHHPSRSDDAGEVHLALVDGTNSRSLTPMFQRCSGLGWNRRTGEIWFTASRANGFNSALWAVAPSGTLRAVYYLPDFFVLQDVSPDGRRCLLVSTEDRRSLLVRRAGETPKDLSWLGYSIVSDISPDGKNVLFYDGGASEKSDGSWIRALDGGDAFRLGGETPGRFSPDGQTVVGLTPPRLNEPQQVVLVPVGAGEIRQLTFSKAHMSPSFAGPTTVLHVEADGARSEVWRIETDGGGARSLGAPDCDLPAADPTGATFVCVGEKKRDMLFVFPMERGPGRKLYSLPNGESFLHARWDGKGKRVLAVTDRRRLLAVDAATGKLLNDGILPLPEGGQDPLYGVAVSADASLQAYSVARNSSGLYLCAGLR